MDVEFPKYVPKLALLGPVSPPFRGGIAHYTSSLRKELASRCDLKTVSFKRLYPAWLYPGASDREPGMEHAHQADVLYTLDALNPYTLQMAVRNITDAGCDLAVINWWTLFWAPGFAWMAKRLRARGVPVAFLCHNLFDHDSGALKRKLATRFLSQADAYLVHSRVQADSLKQRFPSKAIRMHPHPTYDNYPPPTKVLPKRGRLELLFFGFIRPYKGLDSLIDALAQLADRDVYLTVAGEPWCKPGELQRRIRESGAPNVELHLEYVDASAAADYFSRADLVVVPYRKATGSGVAAMAYHYDKPVLATRVGGFPDVIEDGRTGFLIDPDSPHQLATAIRTLDRDTLAPLVAQVRVYKNRFTWSSLADTLIDLALTVMPNGSAA
jgi:glycosyltransferase involved in cell wall biosynthesis